MGLFASILRVLIRAYQLILSPFCMGSCRYLPSCSDYALEAVERHGALKGSWLALCRLLRCHPWGADGYDPVPLATGGPHAGCRHAAEHHALKEAMTDGLLPGPAQPSRVETR